MKSKVFEVLSIAIPNIISGLLLFAQEIINLIFVGHLNDSSIIAAVGLGNAYIAMIGLSTIIGMNGALDTLCSQACKDIDKCNQYLN
jgi:Na+-driven multidrug efflux pump